MQRDIGEGLVSYSPDGELVPGVATAWALSDDGTEYTFGLRPDARWSNGDPVIAADYVLGLQRLVDPATAAFYAGQLGSVQNAEAIIRGELSRDSLGVEAIDDHTLEIRLERPTPYLVALLTHPSTFPVNAAGLDERGAAGARERAHHPEHVDAVGQVEEGGVVVEEQELRGYIAERQLTIEIDDLDKLGALVEGAVAAGVNQVSPPQLDSSKRKETYRQALRAAKMAMPLLEKANKLDRQIVRIKRQAGRDLQNGKPEKEILEASYYHYWGVAVSNAMYEAALEVLCPELSTIDPDEIPQ